MTAKYVSIPNHISVRLSAFPEREEGLRNGTLWLSTDALLKA